MAGPESLANVNVRGAYPYARAVRVNAGHHAGETARGAVQELVVVAMDNRQKLVQLVAVESGLPLVLDITHERVERGVSGPQAVSVHAELLLIGRPLSVGKSR